MKSGEFALRSIHFALIGVLSALALLPQAGPMEPWQVYGVRDDEFELLTKLSPSAHIPCLPPALPSDLPSSWQVTATAFADVTDDEVSEWVLLVWRPWKDWPIQEWSSAPSPIAGFHDRKGESCHLIVIDPVDGDEIWAGSALPRPLTALAVGDVDGDGNNEVTTLEGDYDRGRNGPASHIDVWQWNGFGFSLEWRSSRGSFYSLVLTDVDGDGTPEVAVR